MRSLFLDKLFHIFSTHEQEESDRFFLFFCLRFLAIEVIIRYFASRVSFWRSPFNIFDFLVVLLCVLALALYSYVPDSDVISACSLLLRYITQLMRLIIFLRWLSRNHNALVVVETTICPKALYINTS